MAVAVAVAVAAAVDVAVAGAGDVAVAGVGAGAGAGAVLAIAWFAFTRGGLKIWYRARIVDLGWRRFLAITAFPVFCWFPIVLISVTYGLHRFLSWGWQPISLFWFILLGVCTLLWIRGKNLEEKASNPLKGILDEVKG
jgi:hypothetical protein